MTEETMTIVEFSEDISEAEAPEPLPVGEYPTSIRAAEVKISQRGTRYAAVTFVITPEEYPADYPIENAPDGKTIIFRRCSLEDNPQSRFMLKNFCEAIGATASKKVDVSEWIGLTAMVEVEHDTYEGVTREQITRVNEA
jgi:hypothetical protein